MAPKVLTDNAASLSFDEVATIPKPGSMGLGAINFSPDDRYVTYLGNTDATSLTRQLFSYDRQTGETKQVIGSADSEDSFSPEEKLRRERARIMSVGVTEYYWAKKANRLLVPRDGALYVQDGVGDGADATLRRLFDPTDAKWADVGSGAVLDAKLSDDGAQAFFVWDNEVCACDVAASAEDDACTPRRLTYGARDNGVANGVADYCAQEEMNRYTGYWPSPGAGDFVAFEEVDERHIPLFTIMNQGVEGPHAQNEAHRYPFAGAANPKVRLGVVANGGDGKAAGTTTWFDLAAPFGEDFYLARVNWAPNPASGDGGAAPPPVLLAQVQSRDQRSLALVRLDLASGAVSTVLTETDDAWLNLHDALAPLDGGNELLWASEKEGWRHLYVHSAATGECVRQLTKGEWGVDEVVAVDGPDDATPDGARYVYFLGNPEAGRGGEALERGPYTEQHLFRVKLDGSSDAPERLTNAAGVHMGLALAHTRTCFVDQYSSAGEPMRAALAPLPTEVEAAEPGMASTKLLYAARDADPRVNSLAPALEPPRFVSFPSTDGAVRLQAALYVPDEAVHGPGPYPTIVSCYGGPHVQWVQNSWARMSADLSAQSYRARGYLVVKVDNRGADRRGLAFEAAILGKLGSLEVDDQVAAVKYATSEGLADPARVGIMGWSYGGYLSAMCLAKAPDVFRCAVAGAPVTSWDGYDTHYTERYCGGTPESNPAAYDDSSVMSHVDSIEGALLLVHGLMDENVHFRHTARLTQALVEKQKSYDLLAFPKERHSPRSLKE